MENVTGEPRLLILETSGRQGLVAVAHGTRLLAVRQLDEARRHARDLASAVAALAAGQQWTLRDLDGVIVSLGPGSFTGLRVGIMSAKAMAYATGCVLLGVETFASIAAQAPAQAARLDVIADAQQEKVYVQSYARPSASTPLVPQGPLRVRALTDWLAERPAEAWVSGPGARAYRQQVKGLPLLEEADWDPRPERMLSLGLARYRRGERDDLWAVEPLYVRASAAEEKWQSRQPADRPAEGGPAGREPAGTAPPTSSATRGEG